MSTRKRKVQQLKDKEYRDAYVGEYLHTNIAYQVRALRKQRGWDQKKLADKAGMLQPRISAIENPSNNKLNLDTILRLANAFDVALTVRFTAFSDLLHWSEGFSPDQFEVNSFDKDCYLEHPINVVPDAAGIQRTPEHHLSVNKRVAVIGIGYGPNIQQFMTPLATITGRSDAAQAMPQFLMEKVHGHDKEKAEI